MERHIRNELQLIDDIYRNYREGYLRFAYSYVHDKTVAEDLVSESIMYFWENRDRLEYIQDARSYIFIALKHKCLDYLQRYRTWTDISESLLTNKEWELNMRISCLEACDPYELFSAEIQSLIDETLEGLPEKSVLIFTKSRYDNKTYQDIARDMGISVKTVEFHMNKVLTALRKSLRDYLPLIFAFLLFCKN